MKVTLSNRHNSKDKKIINSDDILFVRAEHFQGINGEYLGICTEVHEGIHFGGIAYKKDNQKLFKQGVLPDPHEDLLLKMKCGRNWVKFPLRSD